tara:strand:+ start:224 stop:382 length:159 start_codon:yes stop_codon:yes gene_type:complete
MYELLIYVQKQLERYDDVPLTTGLLITIINDAIEAQGEHEELIQEQGAPWGW